MASYIAYSTSLLQMLHNESFYTIPYAHVHVPLG